MRVENVKLTDHYPWAGCAERVRAITNRLSSARWTTTDQTGASVRFSDVFLRLLHDSVCGPKQPSGTAFQSVRLGQNGAQGCWTEAMMSGRHQTDHGVVRGSRLPSQNGHLTHRFASTSISGGMESEHSGLAIGHRGENRQPGGKAPRRGTAPGIVASR